MLQNEWIEMITIPELPQVWAARRRIAEARCNEIKGRKYRRNKLAAS
jgi:hypothetical protein